MKLFAYTSIILLLLASPSRSEDTAFEKYLKMSILINSQPHVETALEMAARLSREAQARWQAQQAEERRFQLQMLKIQAMERQAMAAEFANQQEPTYIIITKKK